MSQLPRLISILTLLKSKRLLTATELADKYAVSIRTIYRDIRKLEEAGIPVYSIEGKGYSLVDNYVVPPVQFTEKQANALITAQHIVNQSKDVSFVNDFNEALIKIKSVFRTSIQEKSELLNDKLYVFNMEYEEITSNALSEIQLAITHFNFTTNNKWILIAWCHLRKAYRAFRIDRIQHYKILREQFEDRNFKIQDYFSAFT